MLGRTSEPTHAEMPAAKEPMAMFRTRIRIGPPGSVIAANCAPSANQIAAYVIPAASQIVRRTPMTRATRSPNSGTMVSR